MSQSNWEKWITLTETGEGDSSFSVRFNNGKTIGTFYKDVDGSYVFDGIHLQDSFLMRAIADALDEKNKVWDAEVREYFESQPRGEEPPLNPWLLN